MMMVMMMVMMDSFGCGHGLEISASGSALTLGTCNFKVKLFLQVVVKFLCLQLALGNIQATCNDGEETDPQAPGCLDDCAGRRFFLDRDGICKMCVQCEPGYEHDKECGNGENGDAVCIPCPEDHYSRNLYDCVACRVCENTKITRGCSPSTDRQCGECLPGFYRDPQNPDLCNQRCEWHSNPNTIPSCKEWLANQQGTTLSAVTSQMSSFPEVVDKGTERGSLTLIIIILLVLVLVGGSVIPVYICCKHCRHGGSKSRDIEPCTSHSKEHLDLADVHSRNSENTTLYGDVGADGMNEIGIAKPVEDEVSEVGIILPLSAGREQADSGESIVNEGEDEDPDKTVLDIFKSTSEINSSNDISSTSTFQMNRDSNNGNSYIVSVEPEACKAGSKVVDGILENESSSYMYYPSSNSHGGKSEKLPLEDFHTPGMRNEPKTLRTSEEDAVIGQDELEHRPIGRDSKRAQVSEGRAGDDKEYDGKEEPDERQRLLPDTQVGDYNGGARSGGDEEWRGSAEDEAELTEPTIRKEKEGVRPSAEQGLKMQSQPNITLNIENVQTLVVGNQYQYHYNKSAECPPQGSNEDSNEEDED